jgi:hypothetical protein
MNSKENDNHHTSAVIGTVEFTGLEIIRRLALGECSAAALAKSRTIEALVLNKSVNSLIH